MAALAQDCAYSISPTNRTHGYGATNAAVNVIAGTNCAWTVENTNSWIMITSPASGMGDGIVNYSVEANSALVERTGVVMIATQPFVLRQRAFSCNYSISPTNRTHGYGATTGSVSISSATGCAWNVENTNDWIIITSALEGTGDGVVNYDVVVNTMTSWRTGIVVIADEVFTLIQRPSSCLYSLSPTNRSHGYSAAVGQLSLTTGQSCSWAAVNTNSWITITAGGSGVGSGAITYSVQQNPSATARSGYITVGDGFSFLTQGGAPCTYSLSASNRLHTSVTETGEVSVATLNGCSWPVVNTNAWIDVLSGNGGTGSGAVTYRVNANPNLYDRTGYLTIAGIAYRIRQSGADCTYEVSPHNRNHGNGATVGSILLTTTSTHSNGCPWGVITTNDWITITSATSGLDSATINYSIAANIYPTPRTGVILIGSTSGGAQDSLTINQAGIICSYEVSPSRRTNGFGSVTSTVTLVTAGTCPWIISNTNDWIRIVSISGQPSTNDPPGATGSNTISYALTRNPNSFERSGVLTIGDTGSTNPAVLTIVQRAAPCSYSITPGSRTHGYGATTGNVAVTAVGGCSWGVTNTNSWVTILSGSNGIGNGTVTYAVEANATGNQRSGVIIIGDDAFNLTQLAVSCTYTISPPSRDHTSQSETGTVNVTANSLCEWEVISSNSWITVLSPPTSGNGVGSYLVEPNLASTPRSAVITVAGHPFTVNQAGFVCSYDLTPGDRTHGHGSSTGWVTITTTSNCAWTVVNTNDWIFLISLADGSGNGAFGYSIDYNLYPVERTGVISVGGEPFAVTQRAFPCSIELSPTNRTHGYGASTGSVNVGAAQYCPWDVVTTNDWITITAGSSGMGDGTVGYAIAPNEFPVERSTVIIIGGEPFYLTQRAVECEYSISPSSRNHGYGATTGAVSLRTSAGCAWTIENTNVWIRITSPLSGLGSNSITYAVDASTDLIDRTGVVMIAEQAFTVRQSAATCNYSISPTSRTHGFGGSTGTVSVTTLATCSWLVINTNDWIVITSPSSGGASGEGSVNYEVNYNPVPAPRTGVVMIADQVLTVIQRASDDGPPFAFELIEVQSPGEVRLRMAGAPAGVWEIQTSSNLVDWTHVAFVTNNTGLVEYVHSAPDNPNCRLYRAVLQE